MSSHRNFYAPLFGVLVAAFALSLVGVAQAKTFTGPNAKTASNSIRCYVNQYGSGIECTGAGVVDPAVPNPDLDVYVALKNTGKPKFGQRGDYPGFPGYPKSLHHGDKWEPANATAKKIKCTYRSSGWKCTNHSGHGFTIKKDATELF
jgi:hypothetical protein